MRTKLKVEVNISKVSGIGENSNSGEMVVLVKLQAKEEKSQVMRAKHWLKGTLVYVDVYLAKKEKTIKKA